MKNRLNRYLATVAACAIAAVGCSPAWAAQSDGQADQVAESAGPEGIQDIVVTAQRRSENLQRAAVAVSSVSGDALESASVVNPAQLSAIVPALQISPLGSSFNYYLRGVGNVNGNPLSESAIAFNFGGVYIGRPASSAAFFYDIDRLEVLKGPQGTLYGRNATGGAINVIPTAPGRDFGGNVNAEIGNYGTVNLQGALNIPVSDSAALRLSGFRAGHNGYNKDGTDDQDDWGGRVQFKIAPSSSLTINILADYAKVGGNGLGATPVALGLETRTGATSPEAQAFYGGQPHAIGGRTFLPIPPLSYQNNEFWGISSTIEWQTDLGTLTVLPSHRQSKIRTQGASSGFLVTEFSDTEENSFEARFATPEANPLRAIIGGYHYDAATDVPLFMVNNQFDYVNTHYDHKTKSTAAFGRLTYDVTTSFRLNAGLRYTHETKRIDGVNNNLSRICLTGFLQCPTATPFPYGVTALPSFVSAPDGSVVPSFPQADVIQIGSVIAQRDSVRSNKVTWRVGADWDVGPSSLLYASYETGFKSGGFFFTHDRGVYDPETIRAWTVGSKNRFLDNRLQVNLEAFWWSYADQQISHVALDSAGTAVFITENVGKATIRGAEADITFIPFENTLLNVNAQYLDAKYDQFTYLFPNLGAPPATTCPFNLSGANYTIDCSGFRPPLAPKWTINLGIKQTIPLANSGRLILDGRMHYQSSTLTSLEFLPEEYQKGYATFDAALTYHDPRDRFTIGGYVNNLTDQTVMAGSFIPPFAATNFVVGILRAPRTYGIRAGFSF